MIVQRLAWCAVLGLALAACADREAEITPVILPPTPELRQQAEAEDAAAQFALAEYYLAIEDDAAMLRWLRESACRGYPVAQISLGVLNVNYFLTSVTITFVTTNVSQPSAMDWPSVWMGEWGIGRGGIGWAG
jgi:hypothetical protein